MNSKYVFRNPLNQEASQPDDVTILRERNSMDEGFATQLERIWRVGRNQGDEMNGMVWIGSVSFRQVA